MDKMKVKKNSGWRGLFLNYGDRQDIGETKHQGTVKVGPPHENWKQSTILTQNA